MLSLYSQVEELPPNDGKSKMWESVTSDGNRDAILFQLFGAVQRPPSNMTDAECRSYLSEAHALYKMLFFDRSIKQTLETIEASKETEKEPDFSE